MHKITFILITIFAVSLSYGNTLTATLAFNTLPTTYESGSYGNADATYNGYILSTANGITIALMCDDSLHTTDVPSGSMVYDYATLTGPTPLMDGGETVRFTDGNSALNINETEAYETASVLLSELAGLSNPSADTITDYQYAVWNMFTPADLPVNATQLNLQTSAVALVSAGAPSTVADYSNLVIYTPTAAFASSQEFLGLNTPAPEPASWAFMALLGLLLCIPQVRFRFTRQLARSWTVTCSESQPAD
jgi:hypothetical protein